MAGIWQGNISLTKDGRVWIFLHWLLTETIIVLGHMREHVEKKLTIVLRKDRTFRNHLHELYHFGILFVCCDCGLAHQVFIRGDYLYMRAERPKEYSYTFRYFASKADPIYKGEIPSW